MVYSCEDLTGEKFGHLLVLEQMEKGRGGRTWLCQCDCGNVIQKSTKALKRGSSTVSCSSGCVFHSGKNSKRFTGHQELSRKYWTNLMAGAKARNIEFDITLEEAWDLFVEQNRRCALSGQSIWFSQRSESTPQTASLDRIDSTKGYVKSNCQWVHKDINNMKWNFSDDYFIDICKKVFEFRVTPVWDGTFRPNYTEVSYSDIHLLPNRSIVDTRKSCDTSIEFGGRSFVMPVYPANMKSVVDQSTCIYLASLGWFYTMHRFGIDQFSFIRSMKERELFASISVGVTEDSWVGLKEAKESGLCPEYVTIDVANAWSAKIGPAIQYVRSLFPDTFLIVGNVATSAAIEMLSTFEVNAIKVGIAGGHSCITRNKTGFYRPMVSALFDCVGVTDLPIIADGGISDHGDVAKALACGAYMVMSGYLFSGYEQSAGSLIEIDGKLYKEYFGSASEFNKTERRNVEGRKMLIPYKGDMSFFLKEIKEDLQSSISYAGGDTLSALKEVRILQHTGEQS